MNVDTLSPQEGGQDLSITLYTRPPSLASRFTLLQGAGQGALRGEARVWKHSYLCAPTWFQGQLPEGCRLGKVATKMCPHGGWLCFRGYAVKGPGEWKTR